MAFPLNREQTALSVVRPEHPPAHNHALIGYTTRRDTIVHLGTNISGFSMRAVESFAAGLADSGLIVDLKITDNYNSATSTIPYRYSYSVISWDKNGEEVDPVAETIKNQYTDSAGMSTNIGN